MKTRSWKHLTALAAAATLGLGGAALAQADNPVDTPDSNEYRDIPKWEQPVEHRSSTHFDENIQEPRRDVQPGTGGSGQRSVRDSVSRIDRNLPGMANLRIGGGVETPSASLRDMLAMGPIWTATAGLQPFTWLGLESSYMGGVFEAD